MLSLQCGKATAVLVPSMDCDIVAQVLKRGSRGLDFDFSRDIFKYHFTAVRAGRRTSRGHFLFLSGS